MLSLEERKAIQLPVKHYATSVASQYEEHFMCPMCELSWFEAFDPNQGRFPDSELDGESFDRIFLEWKARRIQELTEAHICRWPHTALQYAAHMLDACSSGRRWAGERSIRDVWRQAEAGHADHISYMQWLCDELKLTKPHSCLDEHEWPGDSCDSRKYCHACIYYGDDMIAFRSVFTWYAVAKALEARFPWCDFTQTNRILDPERCFPEEDYR